MILACKDEEIYIQFTVFSSDGVTPLTGQSSSCTYSLILDNALTSEVVTISEIASTGYYIAKFTPTSIGIYNLEVTCSDGRVIGETIQTYFGDLISRIGGLVQDNYRINSPVYDSKGNMTSAEIITYDSSYDAENNINPKFSYRVSATYTPRGLMTNYTMVRI